MSSPVLPMTVISAWGRCLQAREEARGADAPASTVNAWPQVSQAERRGWHPPSRDAPGRRGSAHPGAG